MGRGTKWPPRMSSENVVGFGEAAPSLFTLPEEQLGLRLVPSKAQVEVIVVDHIEKPTEN